MGFTPLIHRALVGLAVVILLGVLRNATSDFGRNNAAASRTPETAMPDRQSLTVGFLPVT